MTTTSSRYSPEVQARAVRLVLEHEAEYPSQWSAIQSIAAKIGCTAETLRRWVRREERDAGRRAGPTSEQQARLKALERENRELRQANEILRMRVEMEGILAKHTGRTPEQVAKDIERDKILTADDAVEYGVIDQVIASRKTAPPV